MTACVPAAWIDSAHLVVFWDGAIKGALVLLLALGAARLLHRSPAALRHYVWALALIGTTAVPILSLLVPSWRLPVLPRETLAVADAPGVILSPPIPEETQQPVPAFSPPEAEAPRDIPEAAVSPLGEISPPRSAAPATPPVSPPSSPVTRNGSSWTAWVIPVWLVGAVCALTPFFVGLVAVVRFARRARSVVDPSLEREARHACRLLGVKRRVRLLHTEPTGVPMTWGILRPSILLPPAATRWPRLKQHVVMVHEVAHVRRRDCLLELAGRVACAVHWFNPLAWIALRRLRLESERACDDVVINAGLTPTDYAELLLDIARSLRLPRRVSAVAIAMARQSQFEDRLVAILDSRRSRHTVTRLARMAGLAVTAGLAFSLAIVHVSAGDAKPAASDSPYTVAKDGSAPFTSLQKAIDAAPKQAVVRIGPGVYDERITITKPITLVGAGWDKTTLTAEEESRALFDREEMAKLQEQLRAAQTDAGNTFAGNRRAGLELLRNCAPTIRKNIFYENPRGVYRERPQDPGVELVPAVIEGNYFWKNETTAATNVPLESAPEGSPSFELKELPLDEKAENVEADPGFTNVAVKDFTLTPDSPARKGGTGALDHVSFSGSWPLQPAERLVVADRCTREEKARGQAAGVRAHQLAKPLTADIMQIRDAAKRAAAVEKMRQALSSEDPAENYAAIIAFVATSEANYDKASFHDLVLRLTRTAQGGAQVKAFYALRMTGENPDDLELLLEAAAAPSPEMRESASHLLKLYTKGDITGRAADVVLKLLESESKDQLREVMRGLWGAKVSPELARRLLEIARTRPDCRHDAIYFGLSTLSGKPKDVIEELIDCINKNDRSAGRAMWGLGHGVPPEHHSMVADFLLQIFEARSATGIRKDCLHSLGMYAGEKHLAALEAIAANELVSEDLRKQTRSIIDNTRRRLEQQKD